jgi:DNA primase
MTLNADLLSEISRDVKLTRASSHRGGEYHGPCPFCGGTDRFRVQPDRDFWKCRQCGKSGDSIAYLVEIGRATKTEAYALRHGVGNATPGARARRAAVPPSQAPAGCDPPAPTWQARAWEYVAQAQEQLRADVGARARGWLRGRGLTAETITAAGLGYNPRDKYESGDLWGLDPEKRVWMPRGIVIPWFIGGDLWRVNTRRPVGDPKYIGPAGFGNGLYEADAIRPDIGAIIVEGELDALTLAQEAGDIIAAVATGGTTQARRARWVGRLALAPVVLVTFDADKAGAAARAYWQEVLSKARAWRPYWGDANAMHQDGADVRGWVEAGLTYKQRCDSH